MTRSLSLKHLAFQYIRQSLYLLAVALVFDCSVIAAPKPDHRLFPHNQGNIQLVMTNSGGFGETEVDIAGNSLPVLDPLTGEMIFGSVYPRNSGAHYLFSSLWIGARVGNDTIVALGTRLNPDVAPFGEFTLKSLDVTREYYAEDARSQLDLICTFYDTFTDPAIANPINLTLYEPLGLRIDQRSMAWGGGGIDDFVLIEYTITNIQAKALKDLFIGLRIFSIADPIPDLEFDNLTGYVPRYQFDPSCSYVEDLHLAYVFDNNGDPVYGAWTPASLNATMGVAVLGLSADDYIVNYNWYTWVNSTSWGPRRRGTPGHPLRRFKWGLGDPSTDGETYYLMSHPEVDYDQIFTAVDHSNAGWLPPPSRAGQVASGGGARSVAVLSAGPVVDLGPGQIAHFTVAVVGGEHFHHDPTAYSRLWDPYNPYPFYNQLDFSDLAENALWAKWVYDNPGVDSDGDGYAGKFRLCQGETTWYEGDGVPDFKADVPPPAPRVKIIPSPGKLTIRWNGYHSETNIDPFTRVKDFEGYRVYAGLDKRKSSLSVLSSWDFENYNRYVFINYGDERSDWKNLNVPFTLDSLRVMFNDPSFEPLSYTRSHPYRYGDTLMYFEKQDFNLSELGNPGEIHKIYPKAVDPGTDSSLWSESDLTYEHGEGLPKYYEYEYVYDNLLPTVEYEVVVTAFDFGFAKGGIPSKESSLLNNLQSAYAQVPSDEVASQGLDVYVYPNPWRSDADYRSRGYENRDQSQIPERSRRIHFANLPPVCTISIYSLDGDLIRVLEHNYPEGGPASMHEEWDFITRNAMLVTSGLYYFVVESPSRTQVGKFVIVQ